MTVHRLAALAALVLLSTTAWGGQMLPNGQQITPQAASGALFQELDPHLADAADFRAGMAVTAVASPDGRQLAILTSGFNLWADVPAHKAISDEYIFVYDISGRTPQQKQVLTVPNADAGIAFAPDGQHFYVAGGTDDNLHIFALKAGSWAEDGAPVKLGHATANGFGAKPSAGGVAVAANGLLVIADRYNDSITLVDPEKHAVTDELDLRPGKDDPAKHGVAGGEYPLWVVTKGVTAYVTSQRDREVVVVSLDGTPRVTGRIPVKGVPNRMLLQGERLFVASDTADLISVINTKTTHVIATIAALPANLRTKTHFGGAAPNSLALSPDGRTLYATLGGINAVAVVPLSGVGALHTAGLIPTGWYPNSVTAAGDMLYVVNGRSNTGPNPQGCTHNSFDKAKSTACNARNRYVLQLSHAGFLSLPVPAAHDLAELTATVAANNGLTFSADPKDTALMKALRRKIKHVIYVVKENRTYDQVLGDLGRGNSDPSLTLFGEAVTPNEHALARRFVTLDNFYDPGEVSGEGWPWSTDARETDLGVKTIPTDYADRGQPYDVEGQNRGVSVGRKSPAERYPGGATVDPDLLPGPRDVAAPDGNEGQEAQGHLWNAALRAGLSVRNYGFHVDLGHHDANGQEVPLERDPAAAKLRVAFPTTDILDKITDPYYRGFDTRFPDFWRLKEWQREFALQVKHKNMPALSLVRLMTDHMGSFDKAIDGINTPERQVADNDYALGKLVETVANSPFADSTVIFVVEDDAQDGPDHVDAHRSTAFVAGPYVKHDAVVSERYSTVNMLRTIEDILGLKPMSIYDAHQRPMSAVFDLKQKDWSFAATPSEVLRDTALPLPPAASGAKHARAGHDATWWAAKTAGYDWSAEDKINSAAFNQLLWEGLSDGRPYPAERSGKDLSRY